MFQEFWQVSLHMFWVRRGVEPDLRLWGKNKKAETVLSGRADSSAPWSHWFNGIKLVVGNRHEYPLQGQDCLTSELWG